MTTGELVRSMPGAQGAVRHLVPISGTHLLAAGSDGHQVIVFDWSTGAGLHVWATETLNSLCWVAQSGQLLAASTDLLIRLVDPASGLTQRALFGHTSSVASDVAFSPDDRHVLSAGTEKATRLWNRTNAELVRVFEGSGSGSVAAAFSSDGRRVLTTTGVPRKSALLWDTETGQIERELSGHTDWLLSAAFSPDGQQVATTSLDRTVRVWNAATGEPVRIFSAGGNFMYAVAFSADGQRVAGGGSTFDPTVHIWDIASGSSWGKISGDAGSVRAILFPPSGNQIMIGWEEGLIRIIDLTTGELVQELTASGFVTDMALSPDGELLMVAEGWPTFAARIFEWRSGRELRVLTGHSSPVGAVAFNSRGTQVVTGADVVRLWDISDLASRLRTRPLSDGMELTWSVGTLQKASSLSGPWTPLPGAVSPYPVRIDSGSVLFRIEVPEED